MLSTLSLLQPHNPDLFLQIVNINVYFILLINEHWLQENGLHLCFMNKIQRSSDGVGYRDE